MLLQTASRRSRVALCATRLQLPLSPARSPIRCSPWRLDSKAASSSIWRGCHRSTITTMPTLDPDWSWGDGANSSSWTAPPSEDWKTWDPEHADKPEMYRLLTSAVIPRPIAFVSSLSASGVRNLAPFSYFSLISHKPPMVTVSAATTKDTCRNVLETKEFVVNIVSEPFVQAMNSTSIDGPPELDEWEVSGLASLPSETVKPGRVADAAVALECTLHHSMPIGENHMMLLVGHVRRVHVRRDVLAEGEKLVDATKLMAVSRLGGSTYSLTGTRFDIARPAWKNEADAVNASIEQKKSKI